MSTRIVGVIVALSIGGALAAQQPAVEPCPPRELCGTAVIAGTVVAADTGRPIEDAQLRMYSPDVMRVARYAISDELGRFEYAGLLPGRYQLYVMTATGYLPLQHGQRTPWEAGKPIDVANNQRLPNADFVLPRAGAIEGTLFDEFGDPAPNVQVDVSRVEYVAGRHRLLAPPGIPRILTDDKGRYRASGLPPGDYYVSALSGAFADANASGGFAVTFHTGSIDLAAARPLRLPFGRELAGVSFTLIPARPSQLAGRVQDQNGQPVARGTVALVIRDAVAATRSAVARVATNQDGTFVFRNVPPGSYFLQTFGNPEGGGNLGRAPFGTTPVTVSGEDINDLTMTVKRGVVARGTVVFERTRGTADLRTGDLSIGFQPVEFETNSYIGGGPPDSMINPDWTFHVTNQFGLRAMRVDVRPPGWMVKRVTLNGRAVTGEAHDFRKNDLNGFEILVTDAVSSVSGTVVDENRQRSGSYSVILFSEDTAKWTFPSRFIQLAVPNQDGTFTASKLPPENYLAVALPVVQGGEWQDPDFLERLRALAIPVSLNQGEAKTIELRLSHRPD